MANIVTLKNNTTNEINYPRTVKSALLNDDGTPMQPVTMGDLGDIVNTSDIINDLITGGIDKPLSAEQGKTLNTSLTTLKDDRGYIYPKGVTDYNLAVKTGKYRAYNAPNAPVAGGNTFLIDVMDEITTVSQFAVCVFGSVIGKSYIRTRLNDGTTWNAWKEVSMDDHNHANAYVGFASDGSAINISGADLNTTRNTGFYMGANCSNMPAVPNSWFYLTVIKHSANYVYQEMVDLHNPLQKWVRVQLNGTWTAWTDPFGIVVSGKQEIVNAINDSIGYTSGLTTGHTHADYGWWIRNKVTEEPSTVGTVIYKNNAWLNGFSGISTTSNIGIAYYPKFIRYSSLDGYGGNLRSVDVIPANGTYAIITMDFISYYSSTTNGRVTNDITVGYINSNGLMYSQQSFAAHPFYSYIYNGIRRRISFIIMTTQAFAISFPMRVGHYIDIYELYIKYV